MKSRVYLDNSATTFVAPEVLESMLPYFAQEFGNPSSVHSWGQKTRATIEQARVRLANLIGAKSSEIIFLSGGTEANNLAIRGIVESFSKFGNHIITSIFEHPSVLNVYSYLEKNGFKVTYLPVYSDGIVKIEDVAQAVTDETILISIMHANNEIGTIQPIEEVGSLVKEIRNKKKHIYFHTDAIQTIGKIPVEVNKLGIDLLSISGHKMHAAKGIGALYLRDGVKLISQQLGGSQERKRRAGTENVASIAGLGKAAELAPTWVSKMDSIEHLKNRLEKTLSDRFLFIQINGNKTSRLPNITNLSFGELSAESLLIALDLNGIAVSAGSACSSGSTGPNTVLAAIGKKHDRSSLRFSFSSFNTSEDVDYLLEVLIPILESSKKTEKESHVISNCN